VRFLSRGAGYSLYLTAGEAVLVLSEPDADATRDARGTQARPGAKAHGKSVALRMSLVGAARKPRVAGLDELPGKANYFIGKDRSKWRTNVPTYAKVQYQDVYPGIDLVYYGNQRQLEYDFVVAPGADPKKIMLGFKGADRLEIDAQGELVLHAAGADLRQHKPIIYQQIDGVRHEIAGGYIRKGANRVGFQVAAYDASRPLIIDPTLSYSTFLGGGGSDMAWRVAADSDGNAYVTGQTTSFDFPTTSGAFQTVHGFGNDVFVTKLNPSGSALAYSTYLGGNNFDAGNGIAVDANGNAYVTGFTTSTDFPTTPGAFRAVSGGGFVTKLDPAGSSLVYSTYLGGAQGAGIAVDAQGTAYVTGTAGTDFQTTPGAFQSVFGGGPVDAFVMKLNADGSALVYSTYLGGSKVDMASGIAVDTGGNAYVAGSTDSTDFPTTPGAFRAVPGGGFITKLDPAGSSLVYSTYLNAPIGAIAVDAQGNAYVTGTAGTDFQTTPGAFQPALAGSFDAFVAKLNPPGSGLVYSTYLGGTNEDHGNGIAVNAAGNAYVTGYTSSSNFPTTPDAFQPALADQPGLVDVEDVFVTILNTAGSAPVYSTYLGGAVGDTGQGIAVDAASNAYVTGGTASSNFPTTPGVFQPVFRGGAHRGTSDGDAFVAKFVDIVFPPAPTPTGSGTTRSEESAATEIGFWTSYGAETGTFSGGSMVASNVAASSAIFSFTGTAVSWIGVKCNVCGIAAVSIDGGAPTTVNTAGPNAPGSLSSESVFSASGLAAASHTMVIIVTGMSSSGGSYVALDAFDVTAGSATSPLLPPVVLPSPPVVVPPLPPIVGM
jgi:hypothetical protein